VWSNRNDTATAPPVESAPRVVPDLDGPPYLRYNDAVALAWNEGFTVAIVGFLDNPELPAGVVVTQCPPAGAPPEAIEACPAVGVPVSVDTILVEVSSLPDPVVLRVVPDLYGQPEAEARTLLSNGSLRIGTRREAYDRLMPSGRIIEQNPRRGLGVLPGTAVDIIVSAGPPPAGETGLVNPTVPTGGITTGPADEPTIAPTPVPPTPDTGYPGPIVEPTATTELTITEEPTPELPEASPTEAPDDLVLLEDDFEAGNETGWLVGESEGLTAEIRDGAFNVLIEEAGLFWKSQPGRLFADFTYEAEITLDEGSSDGSAGIVFRVQDDDHFYVFDINPLGQYRLRARNGEEWVLLLDWDASPAILPPGQPNIARVTTEGERLTLFINDTQVAVLDAPSEVMYGNGDVGLAAESGDGTLSAQFDNVLVTR
jgi:hypothetical protein